jgi:hypothetical protein
MAGLPSQESTGHVREEKQDRASGGRNLGIAIWTFHVVRLQQHRETGLVILFGTAQRSVVRPLPQA